MDETNASNRTAGATAVEPQTASHEAAPAPPAPDWRDRFADGDAQYRKRLDRFADELAFVKSYRALEQRFSAGDYVRPLPPNASDEEKAAWRRENGLPEAAEGYVEALALPNGVVIGDADKETVTQFATAALEAGMPPAHFSQMVAKYYDIVEAQAAAREDADHAFRQDSENALKTEWRGDYRRNLAAIQSMMANWPDGLMDRLLAGRAPDGRKFGDDAELLRQLAKLARELNPAPTLEPTGAGNAGRGAAERKRELEGMMRDRTSPYWKGGEAANLQQEYRDILVSEERGRRA